MNSVENEASRAVNNDDVDRHSVNVITGQPPEPFSYPSLESLQKHIDRWESLLTCYQCGMLQDSLDQLWQHPAHTRPICTSCADALEDSQHPNRENEGCSSDHDDELYLSSFSPRRISEYLCFGELSREQGAKEVAVVVQRLKLLRELMLIAAAQDAAAKELSQQQLMQIQEGDCRSSFAASIPSPSQQMHQTSKSSLAEHAAAGHPQYPSLQPDFLPNIVEHHQQQPVNQEEGFRYRKYGGQVYDPQSCRKRKQQPEDLKQEEDDELDFPESPPKDELLVVNATMNQDSAERMDPEESSQDDNYLDSQQSHPEVAILQSTTHVETQARVIDKEAAASSPMQSPSDPFLTQDNKCHQEMEEEHLLYDKKFEPSNNQNKSPKLPLLQDLQQDCAKPLEKQTAKSPQDAVGQHKYDSSQKANNLHGCSQETFDSIATEDLPQTADLLRLRIPPTRPMMKRDTNVPENQSDSQKSPTPSQHSTKDQHNSNMEIEQRLPTNETPQAAAGQSQSQPQSLATAYLLETCNLGGRMNLESQNFPQSIDTDALPQTVDFEMFTASPKTDPKHAMTQKERVTNEKARAAMVPFCVHTAKRSNDGDATNLDDSQLTAIDSQLLPQTTDFGKPIFYTTTTKQERDNNNLGKEMAEKKKKGLHDSHSIRSGNNTTAQSIHTAETPKTAEARSRRITPPSALLIERLRLQIEVPTIVVHEELSSEDRMLLSSLLERGLCNVLEMKNESGAASIAQDVILQGKTGILIFNPDQLMSVRDPFAVDSQIYVCLQCFQYLLARVLGWKLLSAECLGAMQRGFADLQDYGVWGDLQLYHATTRNQRHYPWHRIAQWWNCPSLSPSMSSENHRERGSLPLLSGIDVLVAKMNKNEEKKLNEEDEMLLSQLVRDQKDLFCGASSKYRSLYGDQIECLCQLAGANLTSSFSALDRSASHPFVVLIPDTLEDEKSYIEGLVEANILPGDHSVGSKHSKIIWVYYSWIVDSICADTVAPLENYMIDFV